MSLDWYPWYPTAFRKKTLHLTLEQDGAYRRLIDEYMIQRGPLPNNDVALSRMLGVSVEHWQSIKGAVLSFFEEHSCMLVHGRCEEELHEQEIKGSERSQKATHAANKRWSRDRQLKALVAIAMPKASFKHTRRNAQSMPQASTQQCASNAQAMLSDATLHKNKITTSETVAAREGPEETNPAGSLATALPAGALTRQPETEQASAEPQVPVQAEAPPAADEGPFNRERRAKLDALLAAKRFADQQPKAEPDLTIPEFLKRTA